jgi:phospholipid-binding lipoprotein MlaA
VPHLPALRAAALGLVALALAGCNPAPPGTEVWDPYEAENRRIHAANERLDGLVAGDNRALPAPVRRAVSNFADNAGGPADTLNGLLQGRIEAAGASAFRFLINTTFGIGGLFDVAGGMGLESRRTDFGETLHAWGAPEGAYLTLPLLGPSTERDAAGFAIDFLIDPLNFLSPTSRAVRAVTARTLARGIARIGDRADYSEFVDALIIESTDSYARARQFYLGYRRFLMEGGARIDDFDPYEDPYAE